MLSAARPGPSPATRSRQLPLGSDAIARTSVEKSFGAFRRPTLRTSGDSTLGSGRAARSSTAFLITIVRSLQQVFIVSPAERSFSETQIVIVVNGRIKRSAARYSCAAKPRCALKAQP